MRDKCLELRNPKLADLVELGTQSDLATKVVKNQSQDDGNGGHTLLITYVSSFISQDEKRLVGHGYSTGNLKMQKLSSWNQIHC